KEESYKNIPLIISILIGAILGFVSGVVGIGGGIFLSPILFLLRVCKPKYIITTASLFILINSFFGIIGQLSKSLVLLEIQNYWPLLLAVFIGGQIGNFLNLKIFPTRILALVTAILVLFVAMRMGIRFL
ncbi:TSUP family transporter, partial [bacterium]|nr:TSUP family transporter [bacterium]